jgi:uncharacterized protein (DUF697 family)
MKSSFVPTDRAARATALVHRFAAGSAAAGALIAAPGVDALAVAGVQLWMLSSIAEHYSVPFSKNLGKSCLASLLGGYPVAKGSILKFIPGIGSLIGAVAVSGLAAASTYAVGKVFVAHFESGGTFLTFDPAKVREHYAREFEEGKTLYASSGKPANTAASDRR